MANDITLAQYQHGPFGIRATAGGAAGSGWNGTYSFLVAAWDTPEETNYANCRIINADYLVGTNFATYGEAANLAVTTGQSVTLVWALPHPRPKDHISVYFIAGATSDINGYFTKVVPTSGLVRGNIPPYTKTVTLDNNTSVYEERYATIISKNLTDNTVTVSGDISISLDNGVGVSLVGSGTDSGATTVKVTGTTNVVIGYDDNGQYTTVTLAADIADATLGFLAYNVGPICLEYANVSTSAIASMTIEDQFISRFDCGLVNKSSGGTGGHNYEKAYVTPFGGKRQTDHIEMGLLHGGLSAAELWRLNFWQDAHKRLILINDVDTGNATYPAWYIGHIVNLGDQHTYKHFNEDISLLFEVEYEIPATEVRAPYHKILTATAGISGTGTITIGGYYVDKFFAGRAIRIQGSTGNDGYYSVKQTPTYATNVTTIKFDQNLPDNTDNGYLRAYDF